jgi:hypothetical protein
MDLKIDDLLEKVRNFMLWDWCKQTDSSSTAKRQQALA